MKNNSEYFPDTEKLYVKVNKAKKSKINKTVVILILAFVLAVSVIFNVVYLFNLIDNSITISSISSPLTNGDTAVISIKAKPNTYYSCSLYYEHYINGCKKRINQKLSDSGGYVELTCKMPINIVSQTITIEISGGGAVKTTSIIVNNSGGNFN